MARITQTWLVGPPDVLKGTCPVRGALDGNLLPKCSKALSFDSIRRFMHVHRLSAPLSGAGAGPPPHHAGPHGWHPARRRAGEALGLEQTGPLEGRQGRLGALWEVRWCAPE